MPDAALRYQFLPEIGHGSRASRAEVHSIEIILVTARVVCGRFELARLPQPGESPTLCEQRGRRALLGDPPAVQDDDAIRAGRGRQPVGDDERGAA
jgi:hypothetical protein